MSGIAVATLTHVSHNYLSTENRKAAAAKKTATNMFVTTATGKTKYLRQRRASDGALSTAINQRPAK